MQIASKGKFQAKATRERERERVTYRTKVHHTRLFVKHSRRVLRQLIVDRVNMYFERPVVTVSDSFHTRVCQAEEAKQDFDKHIPFNKLLTVMLTNRAKQWRGIRVFPRCRAPSAIPRQSQSPLAW